VLVDVVGRDLVDFVFDLNDVWLIRRVNGIECPPNLLNVR